MPDGGLGDVLRAAWPQSAGVTLGAVAALLDGGRDGFTQAQVAYLMSVAYASGAAVRTAGDVAEMRRAWEIAGPSPTREARVAARIAEMERADELLRLRRRPARAGLRSYGPVTGAASARVRSVRGELVWRDEDPGTVVLHPAWAEEPWPEVAVPGGAR